MFSAVYQVIDMKCFKFDVHGTVHRQSIPPRTTNKMQRYTMFVIAVTALHVSGGFSAHHQELKFQNCTHSIWSVLSLLAATASVGEF
jgi:hypothetical protein